MAEIATKDRLQPSLLDRLTDDEPGVRTEPLERRVLSQARLRELIRRDLAFLLNTTHLASVVDLSSYPEVERSTINFGIPDLAGRPSSTIDKALLVRAVRKAIIDFEPRLLKRSFKVNVTINPDTHDPNALRFEIEADLWSNPMPIRLRLRSDLSLEDGDARVTEVTAEG